jgi:carbonic anhydrase
LKTISNENQLNITPDQAIDISNIIRDLVDQKNIKIIGGLYDVVSGEVSFLDL